MSVSTLPMNQRMRSPPLVILWGTNRLERGCANVYSPIMPNLTGPIARPLTLVSVALLALAIALMIDDITASSWGYDVKEASTPYSARIERCTPDSKFWHSSIIVYK